MSKTAAWWKRHPVIVSLWPWVIAIVYHGCLDLKYGAVVNNGCYALSFVPDGPYKATVTVMFVIHIIIPVLVFSYCFPRMVIRLRKTNASNKVI